MREEESFEGRPSRRGVAQCEERRRAPLSRRLRRSGVAREGGKEASRRAGGEAGKREGGSEKGVLVVRLRRRLASRPYSPTPPLPPFRRGSFLPRAGAKTPFLPHCCCCCCSASSPGVMIRCAAMNLKSRTRIVSIVPSLHNASSLQTRRVLLLTQLRSSLLPTTA